MEVAKVAAKLCSVQLELRAEDCTARYQDIEIQHANPATAICLAVLQAREAQLEGHLSYT